MRWSDIPFILAHTPKWVWLLLAALVVLGLLQSRTRQVTPARLFALPLALCALGLWTVWPVFASLPLVDLSWVTAVVAGASLRLRLAKPSLAKWSADGKHLHLPGSWGPLVLMMSVFLLRYASGVAQAMHPELRQMLALQLPLALGFGGLTGVLLGRSLAYMRLRVTMPELSTTAQLNAQHLV
jgi:hypothetical protein